MNIKESLSEQKAEPQHENRKVRKSRGKFLRIDIALGILRQQENKRVLERINKKLVDLQKLACNEIDQITLQRDTRHVRTSTADYGEQGGEISGLTDDELEIVKTVLDIGGEGVDDSEDSESEDVHESIVFGTRIPTVEYVTYFHDGPWHGSSSEVYLRYAAPEMNISDVLQLVREVSHSMYANYDEYDMGDFRKLKRVETTLEAAL